MASVIQKKQMAQARQYIQMGNLAGARDILARVNSPKARQWVQNYDASHKHSRQRFSRRVFFALVFVLIIAGIVAGVVLHNSQSQTNEYWLEYRLATMTREWGRETEWYNKIRVEYPDVVQGCLDAYPRIGKDDKGKDDDSLFQGCVASQLPNVMLGR